MLKNGKIFIIAILCIQILACSIFNTSAEINEITYNEYLKSNILFETKPEGYSYDNYSFFSYYDDNNYFYKSNIETYENTKLLNKVVVNYYPYKDNIYCILEDNSIIRINSAGKNETFIFKGDNKISNLYADDYVLYFIMDNTIYRYFMSEKILDKLVYHEYLYSYIPISNNKIEWSYLTPEWIKYSEETGSTKNQNNIKMTNIMSYDAITKQNTHIDDFSTIIPDSLYPYKNLAIPLAEYPDGSYFSYKKTGCGCHGIRCKYRGPYLCDCIRAWDTSGSGYAIQGHGFACYVYRTVWGFSGNTPFNTENYITGIKLDEDKDIAVNQIKTFIESNLNAISFIRLTKKTGSKHSMIIATIEPDNKRILAYHANVVTNNCKVRYQYITYEKIVRLYSKVDYAYKGGR